MLPDMTPKTKPSNDRLMRAIRMTVFLAKNPLREARAIVAACVAENMVSP